MRAAAAARRSWYSSPYLVRAAYRYFGPSGVRSRSVGFRIARSE